MPTTMNEKALEDLIVNWLTNHNQYELGDTNQYDTHYALDTGRLEPFLQLAQPAEVEKSGIFHSPVNRRKFLERLRDEITKRGVVDVLRKGLKHQSNTFVLYNPLPSALSTEGEERYALNKFSVVRQLRYDAQNPALALDVAIFINGLPVITMELKNQITGQNTAHAIAQYRTDRSPSNLLFMPKRCAVHFAADDDTVQMCTKLCGANSWFLPFNKGFNDGAGNPVNPNGLKTAYLWEEILTKRNLSNILEHYAQVVTERNPDTRRNIEKNIWPRWHQLQLVRALLHETAKGNIGQRFLVQHSAGSGKSNSITWLAYQLVELLEGDQPLFDSVIIVTDRVNLDKQLRNNMRAFSRNENIVDAANSSETLRQHLVNGKKIILSTVHKFSFILDAIGNELASHRFAVIIDEAHSSQSGKMAASTNQVLAGSAVADDTELSVEDAVNEAIAQYMCGRRMAPNANFYAFTATPKNKTLETFGTPFIKSDGETGHRPFHVYSMKQAIEEGFILDVLSNYTTYESFYHIRRRVEDDPEFDRKQALRKIRHFVERQPETIEKKAEVMVEHFHTSVAHKIGGQARCMVCTTGIQRAIDYFFAINRLLSQRDSQYRAIVAFSGDFEYNGKTVNEGSLNGFPSAAIEKTFRTGNYRFLIVADKFQTGYDEPLLHTMYVDKPLHGLQTVQTLSRLNRTCPKKEDTFVLDFVNTCDDVEQSFQTFYKTTILSRETDPNRLNDLLAEIEQHQIYTQEELETLNARYWNNEPRATIDPLLDAMCQRFCTLSEEEQVECKSTIKAYIRTYEFLSTIMQHCSVEWEKAETLLKLLVRKLPSLGTDDLTRGLIEAIDFDRYRLEKKEERKIQLQNADTEIEPVPTATAAGVAEPDMQRLSVIETQFNELFGSTDWDDIEVVKRQVEDVTQRVTNDNNVRDAMLNNDEQTAAQECDEATNVKMADMAGTYTQLISKYMSEPDFQERFNQLIRERVKAAINPEYDEQDLAFKLRQAFKEDFADFCDGVHNVEFDEVLRLFFCLVNAETIPALQGLRRILRNTLNCLYRAQHREEDFRTWYADLVSRFEAFLKKIYWLQHGVPMPLVNDGREPALLDAVRHFPRISSLYHTRNPKHERFKQYYNVVFTWRNKENHSAEDLPANLLPAALHAAVAMYLYATMVSAPELKGKL